MASLEVLLRTVVATVLMASVTFVLGTVVGYQYHSLILRLPEARDVDRVHRNLVLCWYGWGILIGFFLIIAFDLFLSRRAYFIALTLFVLLLWIGWWLNAHCRLRARIRDCSAGWEFSVSCLTLGLVSAISGTVLVGTAFRSLGWGD